MGPDPVLAATGLCSVVEGGALGLGLGRDGMGSEEFDERRIQKVSHLILKLTRVVNLLTFLLKGKLIFQLMTLIIILFH